LKIFFIFVYINNNFVKSLTPLIMKTESTTSYVFYKGRFQKEKKEKQSFLEKFTERFREFLESAD